MANNTAKKSAEKPKSIMLGAYADNELHKRIERECSLDYGRAKSSMILILLNEALDARDSARSPKRKGAK